MSEYLPDRWCVVRCVYEGETVFKVLGSWGGGYLTGDSWKLNSGITDVWEDDKFYTFKGHSGSLYVCRKPSYGMTGYTAGVIQGFKKQASDRGGEFEVMPEDTDWLTLV